MKQGPPHSYWLAIVLIVFLGSALRLVDTMRLPLFIDEAIHIHRAHRTIGGELFIGVGDNKWLFPVVLSLLEPMGPEAPWLARAVSALFGTLSVAACVTLGNLLGDRRTGLLAGLLYAVMPMAVFHERQALVDPLLATFTTLSTVMMIRMAHRPRLWLTLPLGATLAGAYLTKVAALPYLALPPVAAVLLSRRRATRWPALALSVLALILALIPIFLVYQEAARQGWIPGQQYRVSFDNLVLGGSPEGPDLLTKVWKDLRTYFDIIWGYVQWPVLASVALAGVWAALGEKRRDVIFLTVPALLFVAVPVLTKQPQAGFLAPRYFLATAAPLAALAALGLWVTWAQLDLLRPKAGRWIGLAAIAVALMLALWFDLSLIHDPTQARLPEVDRNQYITGDPSGYGWIEITTDLLHMWHNADGTRIDVLTADIHVWLDSYLGPRVGTFDRFRSETDTQRAELAQWLARGDRVFFLDESRYGRLPSNPYGVHLELAKVYDGGARGRLQLFQVTGVDGPLADEIYGAGVPVPDRLGEMYAALAVERAQRTLPSVTLAFPASHAPTLATAIGSEATPLEIGRWPLGCQSIEAALDKVSLPADKALVDVVLVDEAHVDPERELLQAFQQRWYWLDEAWFGLLHRLTYVLGPSDPPLESAGVQYEGVISLSAVSVLDREVPAGGVVRIALAWESSVVVQDSFHVFVHIVDADGRLRAQHDSVPGNGLLPMTSWAPGETVVDRFAIRLPPDLPPGMYTVWVGIYHPASGLRLPVTAGQDVGPDYAVVGSFEVVAPDPGR